MGEGAGKVETTVGERDVGREHCGAGGDRARRRAESNRVRLIEPCHRGVLIDFIQFLGEPEQQLAGMYQGLSVETDGPDGVDGQRNFGLERRRQAKPGRGSGLDFGHLRVIKSSHDDENGIGTN